MGKLFLNKNRWSNLSMQLVIVNKGAVFLTSPLKHLIIKRFIKFELSQSWF